MSHVAATAYGNLLLVAGGFSGYVRGDLVAFKFPSYVAPPQVSMQFKHFAKFVKGSELKQGSAVREDLRFLSLNMQS